MYVNMRLALDAQYEVIDTLEYRYYLNTLTNDIQSVVILLS